MDQRTEAQPSDLPAEASAQPEKMAGLTTDQAQKLLAQYGENAIREERVSPIVKFLSYFWGPIPWMIERAAAISIIQGIGPQK